MTYILFIVNEWKNNSRSFNNKMLKTEKTLLHVY